MIISIILGIFLALVVGGYFGFRFACVRQPEPDWEDQASLDKTMWKNHPISIPDAARWVRENGAVDVSIQSHDGLKLVGQWLPAENPVATVILFHGYHSHYLSDFGGILPLYHKQGLNLLMVRQRAHGASEGKYITFGVKERLDALSWVEYHNRTYGPGPVYLGGLSMGCSTVLFAAGEQLPENVKGITADCGFTSPAEILALRATTMFHFPGEILLPFVQIFSRLLAGFSLWECDSRKTVARATVPILFIHGKADDFVPCRMTEEAFAACVTNKQVFLVEGAGHGMGYVTDKERIRPALLAFFRQHLTTIQEETV